MSLIIYQTEEYMSKTELLSYLAIIEIYRLSYSAVVSVTFSQEKFFTETRPYWHMQKQLVLTHLVHFSNYLNSQLLRCNSVLIVLEQSGFQQIL